MTNWKKSIHIAAALAFTGMLAAGCGDDSDANGDPQEEVTNNATTNNATTNNGMTDNNGTSNNGTTTNNSTANNGMTGNNDPDPDSVELPDPAQFDFSSEAVFSMNDVIGDFDGVQFGEDADIICTSCTDEALQLGSTTLFPVDNGFGYNVIDFVGASEKPRDGVHDDGFAGDILDEDGNHIGLALSTVATKKFKTGPGKGGWCGGVHPEPVKCITEHRTVMEHVLTCHESVPYMFYDYATGLPASSDYDACPELDHNFDRDPATLTEYFYDIVNQAFTEDYAMRLGEHPGEYKMVWGDMDKRPTDMRVVTRIPLPDEFQSGTYNITRAELAIVHTITNNSNDKIRPEDIDNESAIGQLPGYTVDSEGRWLSDKDCYEGDGDFIPAGTVLKNPAFTDETWITEDIQDGFTNAWYTTLDRSPFEWNGEEGPRWRLKNPKFGQDLPAVEIPAQRCAQGPLQRGEKMYYRGDLAVTHINLLDPDEGDILFATSEDFVVPDPEELAPGETDLTADGVRLTPENLDLVIYIKGDRSPVSLYKAVLYLDYEPAE